MLNAVILLTFGVMLAELFIYSNKSIKLSCCLISIYMSMLILNQRIAQG